MSKKDSPHAAPIEKLLGSIRAILGRIAYMKAGEVEAALQKAGDRLIADLDALAAEEKSAGIAAVPDPLPAELPAPADPVEFKPAFDVPAEAAKAEEPAAKKKAKK